MRTFFTHGKKKRYAGNVVWPKEEFVVRGYEIRRTDAFELQSVAQREIFDLILKGDTNGAVDRAKELVQAVRRGTVPLAPGNREPIEKLVISWIVTDGDRTPQEVEPFISGMPVTVEPDWDYYARRLSQTLSYVTEVYGWDEKSLLAGALPPKQVTLFGGSFEGTAAEEVAPRRASKK